MTIDYGEWSPRINQSLCTGCGYCVDICPTEALSQMNGKAHLAQPEQCIYCFACEDVCPEAAIELPFLIVNKVDVPAN